MKGKTVVTLIPLPPAPPALSLENKETWSNSWVGHSSPDMSRAQPVPRLTTDSFTRYLPVFSAQAAPYSKPKILLCLIVCLLLGAGTLDRFLKSNYAYYWLGFQKPSLFAECINFQPSPSLILPDSPILQVDNCADEQWRKAVTKNQRWKKWDSKMEREIPDDIFGVHGVPKPSPWMSQLWEPINSLLNFTQYEAIFFHLQSDGFWLLCLLYVVSF